MEAVKIHPTFYERVLYQLQVTYSSPSFSSLPTAPSFPLPSLFFSLSPSLLHLSLFLSFLLPPPPLPPPSLLLPSLPPPSLPPSFPPPFPLPYRLVATEEENKQLKIEMSELRARHRIELERVNQTKEREMAEVHERVKQAIEKKEENLRTVRVQHEAALKRADHLEMLLERQRKELVKK